MRQVDHPPCSSPSYLPAPRAPHGDSTGYITRELLAQHMPPPSDDSLILVCGARGAAEGDVELGSRACNYRAAGQRRAAVRMLSVKCCCLRLPPLQAPR